MSRQQGPLDLSRLRGSVAVVTGAGNGGIGYGICARACELGLDVAVLDLHDTLVADAVAGLSAAYPSARVRGFRCDVTQPSDLAAAAAAVRAAFGGRRVGALFANAGVYFSTGDKGVLAGDAAHWRTTLDVNVLGVVHTLRAFVPAMRASAEPSVVCATASIAGLARGFASIAAYSASKHAVVALCEALSAELAAGSPQVRVHALCPCIVKTSLEETSRANAAARPGARLHPISIDDPRLDDPMRTSLGLQRTPYALNPTNHARQAWDRIAAGEFYMITDSVRPYVDHDFPFGGAEFVARRFAALSRPDFDRSIDNAGAIKPAEPSSPMIREVARRQAASQPPSKL